MERNGMEWVKILEINRDRKKVLKKIEEVQNCYDEIWEEIENGREWAFHLKWKGWYLAYDVGNGMEEGIKFLKNHP